MRRLFIVLGFITVVLALILAVTPLSQIAYIPAAIALLFAFIAFYLSKQKQYPKKSIQLIFLLSFIALVLTTYKSIFNTAEVGNVDELELREEESLKDSEAILEELDIEIDDSDLELMETEDAEGLEEQ
jgi:hypothetical protein